MTEEQKTIAIDTAAVLEKQGTLGKGGDDVPKTVAIDGEELAQRLESARREHGSRSPPASAPASRPTRWLWLAVLALCALAAYLVVGR